MKRLRWTLPIAHLLLDSIFLCLWIWQTQVDMSNQKSALAIKPIAYAAQDDGGVTWEPTHIDAPIPGFFQLLAFGNVPAAVISMSIRREAWYQYRTKLWDPVWFAIHEAISFPIWWLLGALAEASSRGFRRMLTYFIFGRIALAIFGIWQPYANLGALEFLYWFALSVFLTIRLLRWGYLRFTSASQPTC